MFTLKICGSLSDHCPLETLLTFLWIIMAGSVLTVTHLCTRYFTENKTFHIRDSIQFFHCSIIYLSFEHSAAIKYAM